MQEAGRQLQVDYVLEGSVLRAGERLRINMQLVRVRDDVSLWSDKFERQAADVFANSERDLVRGRQRPAVASGSRPASV